MAKKTTDTKMRRARLAPSKADQMQVEARADMDVLRGRYANLIHCTAQEEEFVLDFLTRAGDQAIVVSRIIITPNHAKRLHKMLGRQFKNQKKKTNKKS